MLDTPAGPVREGLSSLERVLVLKKLPTFGSLPSAELAIIADVTRERFFSKGSVLLTLIESMYQPSSMSREEGIAGGPWP